MSPDPKHQPPRAIGYVRVSTGEQARSGLGLDAQRSAILAEAERRGWDIEFIEDAGVSGKSMDRPGIKLATALLDAGKADILVAAKLDRVSRSVADGATLLRHARSKGWSVVVLDMQLDTTTTMGNFAANIVLAFAELERDMASDRTRAALTAKRARGERMGRPQTLPDDVVQRILSERSGGSTMAAIARQLTEEGVPTARGGSVWHASSIQAVLKSQRGVELRKG
ncbi:recombinase family protein [Sinomonas soli]